MKELHTMTTIELYYHTKQLEREWEVRERYNPRNTWWNE